MYTLWSPGQQVTITIKTYYHISIFQGVSFLLGATICHYFVDPCQFCAKQQHATASGVEGQMLFRVTAVKQREFTENHNAVKQPKFESFITNEFDNYFEMIWSFTT